MFVKCSEAQKGVAPSSRNVHILALENEHASPPFRAFVVCGVVLPLRSYWSII